ncbi:helix-turn-helix transcriptional regulator [Bacillus sp. B-TM1]
MKVRGAPAIGVSAAYGVYLGAKEVTQSTVEEFVEEVKKVCAYLATSRPTAVNLFWALERMEAVALENAHLSIGQLKDRLLEEMTNGEVKLGPGTLYGNTTKLLKEKLIVEVASTDRKKCYELTPLGKEVLELEYNRLQRSVRNGNSILGE